MIETPKVGDQSLIYMYGLSDFWADIFGDTELVESVLASSTITMGEVYSYFLQRAAGISLTDIEERYRTRLKLLRIDTSSALDEAGTTFPIDPNIELPIKISNRPILPTQTLDADVHYEIIDGTIRFYKPLETLKFPVRHTSSGTQEYALWMCDVEVDEQWIDNSFGRLVGFTEEDAIFNYKSFLEGIYYLYANGPNIAYIERGVNLAMGMPYARATETVLDVRQDAYTGNWIVFTNTQSYELPFGYRPDLQVGDTLTQNEVLTTWVEVRDYVRNGEWWYNIYLPREVLSNTTDYKDVGLCVPGSTGDKMMQNFLKHHMFEVLITQPNGDESSFNTARNLVLYSKPEYTFPVFVWRAPIPDEIIDIQDDIKFRLEIDLADTMISPPSVRLMDRGTDDYTFVRGKHWYNRVQGSMYAATLLGYGDWPGNAGWAAEFSSLEDRYLSYMDRLMKTRGDLTSPHDRSTITRGWRGHVRNQDVNGNPLEGLTWSVPGTNVHPTRTDSYLVNERDLTPLYMLSKEELVDKMRTLDSRFSIKDGEFKYVVTGLDLPTSYDLWMVRNAEVLTETSDDLYQFVDTKGDLDIKFSPFANQSYVPARDDMYDENGDPIVGSLFISKNTESAWTVQWIRERVTSAPTLFPVEDQDHLQAIEVYDQNTIGDTFRHSDKYIAKGQRNILSPVLIGSEGIPLITVGDYFIPSYLYEVEEDSVNITLEFEPQDTGISSWLPWAGYLERIVLADGDTYLIPEEDLVKEDLILAYSPITSEYEFITDFTVAPDPGAGTIITLDTALPTGGDLIITYTTRGDSPEEEVFAPAGTTYTIQPGNTVKIFTEGRLVGDIDYSISGTQLTFNTAPTSDIYVRYYPVLEYTLQSSFNRSSVQRNEARMLMDRGRENGEYDDFWDGTDGSGTPNIYMNRSGKAWLEVPELGETPVYADSINVVRRLR